MEILVRTWIRRHLILAPLADDCSRSVRGKPPTNLTRLQAAERMRAMDTAALICITRLEI
jgi:hypothetical protein